MSLIKVSIATLAISFLAACGGGDDLGIISSASTSTGSSQGASQSVSSLKQAYEKINGTMTYAQVVAIVGYGSNYGVEQHSDGSTTHKWAAGQNTTDFTLLSVGFNPAGTVHFKIVVSNTGNSSQAY